MVQLIVSAEMRFSRSRMEGKLEKPGHSGISLELIAVSGDVGIQMIDMICQ